MNILEAENDQIHLRRMHLFAALITEPLTLSWVASAIFVCKNISTCVEEVMAAVEDCKDVKRYRRLVKVQSSVSKEQHSRIEGDGGGGYIRLYLEEGVLLIRGAHHLR